MVLLGEVGGFWYRGGPAINVQDDPNCCFFCACATHLEAAQVFHEWDVFNATGKSFDFGGHFYNNPRALNGP